MDADVQVLYKISEWGFNGENSFQYESSEWGDVAGVAIRKYAGVETVNIYGVESDLEVY
jgi:hypothetical protein